MNRLKFASSSETELRCDVCFQGKGRCDCGDGLIFSDTCMENGVMQRRVIGRRIITSAFNHVSGNNVLVIGNGNYVMGETVVFMPNTYAFMSTQPTGPTFPIS